MQLDFNYLLEKKPDFYELTQREQIKYLCFVYSKNNNQPIFAQKDIKDLFEEFNLVVPSHLSQEFSNLTKGKVPALVKKIGGYAIHPSVDRSLTLELFSNTSPDGNEKKSQNTSLFSKYDFHPEIKRVAFREFQDGYYKTAIQNALVEVIDQVKNRTDNPTVENNGRKKDLDGDDLMNRVFGCDGENIPMIRFNSLSNGLDKAEQRGIMNLFKGIVGVRDRKAHLNFIQNDPLKTIEYLSLSSLLMRLLDENPPS
ncbi:MAG: TIGR02391 family protein [Candidatus Levybacteria bacterium RIFCSPLOWO2_01_FULL_36_13]|nr:MAG: TIGR02391 family protein [Candidatus Levybacteria bacterium RIFCSPHIGHO2_01_FULL_36_15b]OGH35418.1 MAG: TIGR02391 family protein [Candidatus Levybacteria bacterium RIFCSPLOWO2_01_FULL_36_13]